MPIEIPTIEEINSRMSADLIQSVNTGQSDISKHIDPNIRNSFIASLVNAMTGGFDENNKVLSQLLLQLFIDTATDEFLQRLAAIYGINLNPATLSSGFVTFGGTATTDIPNNTPLQKADGTQYETQALATISAQSVAITTLTSVGGLATATTGSAHKLASGIVLDSITGAIETEYNVTTPTITVISDVAFTYEITGTPSSPATGSPLANFTMASVKVKSTTFGDVANADSGSPINLVSPIIGVLNTGFVQFEGLTGGVDQEDNDSLRTRTLERTANMTAPFSVSGLPIFIKENNSGVTRVFIKDFFPTPGAVTIYPLFDNNINIIPSAAQAQAIKDTIIDPETGIKPANTSDADVIVIPPVAVPTTFTFTALNPNTASMQAAIEENINDFFRNETEVGQDITEARYNNIIFATVDSTGVSPTSFTLSAPSGDVVIADGELATLSPPINFP